MSVEFPEPKTEDEAQRIKRFLEAGGQVELSVIQAFKADGIMRATVGKPGTVTFPAKVESVLAAAATSMTRRITITLEFSEVKASDLFTAAVFMNNPGASLRTTSEDPGFAGEVGFFIHTDHPGSPLGALVYELDITAVVKRLQRPADAITATVVLHPLSKLATAASGLAIPNASVRVLDSIVKRKS
jgi:hypothetical protein